MLVPSAEQLAAVLLIVGTAGVANCAALLNEAEAAEVQPPLAGCNGIGGSSGHSTDYSSCAHRWTCWGESIGVTRKVITDRAGTVCRTACRRAAECRNRRGCQLGRIAERSRSRRGTASTSGSNGIGGTKGHATDCSSRSHVGPAGVNV